MSKRIHIVPHDGGWATRREGASPVGSDFTRPKPRRQVRRAARRYANAVRSSSTGGTAGWDANSYGNDPFPPKG